MAGKKWVGFLSQALRWGQVLATADTRDRHNQSRGLKYAPYSLDKEHCMPFPWTVEVAFATPRYEEFVELTHGYYCLPDLIKHIQGDIMAVEHMVMLVDLPIGDKPMSIQDWLIELSRNYHDGKPGEAFDHPCTMRIVGAKIVIKTFGTE